MAEKKSWRDYMEEETTEESTTSKTTGTWRDYMNDTTTDTSKTTGSWRDYADAYIGNAAGKNVYNQVNSWLQNHNSYVSDFQKRYSDRKFGYEDDYVSDSADWLNTTTKKKADLKNESDAILSYLDQYGEYLDADWVSEVKTAIGSATTQQQELLSNASKDNVWWGSFGTAEMVEKYGSAEDAYKYSQRADGYYKKYAGKTYAELSNEVNALEDGEEKEWLKSYAASVDYDEKGKADRGQLEKELAELEDFYNNAYTIDIWQNEYQMGHEQYDAYKMGVYGKFVGEYDGDINKVMDAINQKKAYIEESDKIKELNSWESVTENADFAQKSSFVNPDDERSKVINLNPMNVTEEDLWLMVSSGIIGEMSDQERAVYNYYYATEGKEKADEYFEVIRDTLEARHEAAKQKAYYDYANANWWQGALASVGSVFTSLLSGVEYLQDAATYGFQKLTGQDAQMDKNNLAMITNAFRQGVSDQVDWKIGNWDAFDFLYNTAMSGVDSAASIVTGPAAPYVLGLSAAAQGTNDALERGMSSDQAFWNGLFSGAAEMAFEKWSIGNFKALKEVPVDTAKDSLKNLAKAMLVNATEETLTEISNIAYDTLVNGEFANYTIEELKNGAWTQALHQIGEAGVSGGLMGAGFGSIANSSSKRASKKALDKGRHCP